MIALGLYGPGGVPGPIAYIENLFDRRGGLHSRVAGRATWAAKLPKKYEVP